MIRKALIFGTGGHARVIASLIRNRYAEVQFVDITPVDASVLPERDVLAQVDRYRNHAFFLGIGANHLREKVFNTLQNLGIKPAVCVADGVFLAHDTQLGAGTVVCPGAVIMTGANVGKNVIINTLSGIDHDCEIGDHSQIAPGVSFAGTTRTGKSCFFGIKSATGPNVTIGDGVVVRAASLVLHDLPAHVVAGGIPAKVLRPTLLTTPT